MASDVGMYMRLLADASWGREAAFWPARAPLESEADRSKLVALAYEHRVLPLVADQLLADGGFDPQRIGALELQLRHRYRKVERHVLDVAAAGAEVGVEIGILKGVANAERWFASDPSARTCGDIDVFGDPADPDALARLLRVLDPDHPLGSAGASLMRAGVLPDLAVRSGPVLVELHHHPLALSVPATLARELWSSAERIRTRAGASIVRLDPTWAALQALVNSAKDNHAYLLQVVEAGRALRDPAVRWSDLVAVVRELRWDAIVADAVAFVSDVLRIDPPPTSELRPTRAAVLALARVAPRDDRLGGRTQWRRAQRFTKLELCIPGARLRLVGSIAARSLSPDAYISAYAPELRGPYLFRAVRFWVRRQQYVSGRRSTLGDGQDTVA